MRAAGRSFAIALPLESAPTPNARENSGKRRSISQRVKQPGYNSDVEPRNENVLETPD